MKQISTLQVLLATGWLMQPCRRRLQQPGTITDTTTNLPASKPFGFSTNFEFSTPLTNEAAAPPIGRTVPVRHPNQPILRRRADHLAKAASSSSPIADATGVLGGAAGFGSQTQVPAGPGMFRLGPLDFHPTLNYSFMDATGVKARPGTSGWHDCQYCFSGAVDWQAGDHWVLNYTEQHAILFRQHRPERFDQRKRVPARRLHESRLGILFDAGLLQFVHGSGRNWRADWSRKSS